MRNSLLNALNTDDYDELEGAIKALQSAAFTVMAGLMIDSRWR
ncbi:hypothetical protein BN137_1653 [Cronobacter condimenti 1330]|uniref:Uncharacterized protein n=1 Tax=Cronobacter condimenti 1330 TaxID=1073999 RepID=K7ZZK8_9ENTR|nr:hypothetical protein BN137_1653 [Cronobacter condimenti 1330]